jgi:beta-1,2-mannobiose phosphorylase / 1,2-beta-oligomannan phosphorylase
MNNFLQFFIYHLLIVLTIAVCGDFREISTVTYTRGPSVTAAPSGLGAHTVIDHTLGYTLSIKRLNGGEPVLSAQSSSTQSIYEYNYNAAFVPPGPNPGPSSSLSLTAAAPSESVTVTAAGPGMYGGLVVRCQNTSGNDPYKVGPSVIAYSRALNSDRTSFGSIASSDVIESPTGAWDSFGTEDPRVAYDNRTGTYYMLYSAVNSTSTGVHSNLALATAKDPSHRANWTEHGYVFPHIAWSKSGALLIRATPPHHLFWGDSTLVKGLQHAMSDDLLHYSNNDSIWLPVRPDSWDSLLVEAGPPPMRLSNGNYIFIYNSARHGYPSPKPNWDVQYNVGYVILDSQDPSKILSRSEQPILSPELPWEIGTSPYLGLTPNVVFVEGMARMEPFNHQQDSCSDSFQLWYGAADSVVGSAVLTVDTCS